MSVSLVTLANFGKKKNFRTTDILPLVETFYTHGVLHQVICQIREGFHIKEVIPAMPTPIRYPFRLYEKLFGAFPRARADWLFDTAAAFRLTRSAIVFFHGGFSFPKTVQRAKKHGALAVDISVSAHTAENARLEKEELALLGYSTYEGYYVRRAKEVPPATAFDYQILMSEFTRNTYESAGYPRERMYIAKLDIDTERFVPSVRAKDAPFEVLYLAHTQPLKGLHYLLDAWEALTLSDITLTIVGGFSDMPEALEAEYRERIARDARITYVPVAHAPEKYFATASVFVFPSLSEGFGRVTMEAMASGIPVITTEHAVGIVEDGKTGYVLPIRDAEAIREKISYLYAHKEEREEMGRMARRAVLEKKSFGEEVYDIYEDILKREGKIEML